MLCTDIYAARVTGWQAALAWHVRVHIRAVSVDGAFEYGKKQTGTLPIRRVPVCFLDFA